MRDGVLSVSLSQLKDCAKYFDLPKQFTVIGPVGSQLVQEAFAEATQSKWQVQSELINAHSELASEQANGKF